MGELDQILRAATAQIAPLYFHFPIHGGPPVFRERVYCYELYHQLRMIWPTESEFTLNGEVDKRGHPILRDLGARLSIPDLLVHTPGNMERNHAIIEVKSGDNASNNPAGIEKDLTTLAEFQTIVGYQRGLYLFYGHYPAELVLRVAERLGKLPPIEIWVHEEPGCPAELKEVVARG